MAVAESLPERITQTSVLGLSWDRWGAGGVGRSLGWVTMFSVKGQFCRVLGVEKRLWSRWVTVASQGVGPIPLSSLRDSWKNTAMKVASRRKKNNLKILLPRAIPCPCGLQHQPQGSGSVHPAELAHLPHSGSFRANPGTWEADGYGIPSHLCHPPAQWLQISYLSSILPVQSSWNRDSVRCLGGLRLCNTAARIKSGTQQVMNNGSYSGKLEIEVSK